MVSMGRLNGYLTSDSPLESSTSISMLMGASSLANTPHRSLLYLFSPLELCWSVRYFDYSGF